MPISVNSIDLENFKSFQKESLKLNSLTVLIGPNGSGKTNFLEGVKLAFSVADYGTPIDNPFLPFWGYSNAVYNYDDKNYIGFKIDFTIENFQITYELKFTGRGGLLNFLEETISLKNYLEIKRRGSKLSIEYSKHFFDRILKDGWILNELSEEITSRKLSTNKTRNRPKKFSINQTYDGIDPSRSIFLEVPLFPMTIYRKSKEKDDYSLMFINLPINSRSKGPSRNTIPVVSPVIKGRKSRSGALLDDFPIFFLYSIFGRDYTSSSIRFSKSTNDTERSVIFIRHDSIYGMKRPVPINYALEGTINGERAVLWLFKYFTGHAGKVPDRIQSAIEDLFPGWQLSFKTTEDGNIILQVSETDRFENILCILPPSLPDGFFKLVLILTAVEMNPTILLIDEIENSLHESILDYLIDSLRDSHITTIITTHSPLVVNNVELSEIRILEREANGTKIKMINKPEEMKRKLLDMGITPSDFWLYGEIA